MQPASSPHPTKNKSFFNRIQNVAEQQTKTPVSLHLSVKSDVINLFQATSDVS